MEKKDVVLKKRKGITLIALVITIIILLILAGVTLNLTLGENGLIEKTKQTQKKHSLESERERLELVKATVAMNNNREVTVDKYIEQLIKEKIILEEDVVDIGNGSKDVVTDNGYNVNIAPKGEKDVIITIEGEVGKLPVKIVNINLTISPNSIKIDLDVRRTESAKYKYYYKTKDGEYKDLPEYEGEETSYTITNLKPNTYVIKVEATNKNGTITKEVEGIIEPVKLEDLEEGKNYINYKTDNGKTIKCVILYEADSEFGLQIVAMSTVENVLIREDGWPNENNYNQAISLLHERAGVYINSSISSSVRCIGSVPNNPLSENTSLSTQSQGNKLKLADNNYIRDYNQMSKLRNIKYWSKLLVSF